MKGFIEEYGKIIVVIILMLLMLGFGQTGLAKPIQNSLLKSTGMITNAHNKFDEVTKEPELVTPGAIIDIEGTKYVVLEQKGNNQALVTATDGIGNKKFQSTKRSDGKHMNTYEGSDIDNYLENEWYNNLPSIIKNAIQTTDIKQTAYIDTNGALDTKQSAPNEVYNTLKRHVFLPSVNEINKVVDFNNSDTVYPFLNNEFLWTRDSCFMNSTQDYFVVEISYSNANLYIAMCSYNREGYLYARPTFTIDLSKVDYTEAGHLDSK